MLTHRPAKGDRKRGIGKGGSEKGGSEKEVTLEGLKSDLSDSFVRSPFSDPPLGDSEHIWQNGRGFVAILFLTNLLS